MPPHGQCPFPSVWTTNRPGLRDPEHALVARPNHNSSARPKQVTASFLCLLVKPRSPGPAASVRLCLFTKKVPSLRFGYSPRNPRYSLMQGRAGQARLTPQWQVPSRVADWLTSAGRSVLLTRQNPAYRMGMTTRAVHWRHRERPASTPAHRAMTNFGMRIRLATALGRFSSEPVSSPR